MTNVVVVGAQWGDEGKGKIVDWLSEQADIVVRFQGGHNAGHTLVINGNVYKLALLPSGVVRSSKLSVIGNGVVFDPQAFLAEVEKLISQGIAVSPDNLRVAENVTLILPLHRELDALRENYRRLKARAAPAACAGVVKADGYGLGAVRVARALAREGCDNFFVAHLGEGVVLIHEVGKTGRIGVRIALIGSGEVPVEVMLRPLRPGGVDLAGVEALSLVGVAQQVIGRRYLLESLLGSLVAGVEVRVQLLRQLAISTLDLGGRRGGGDAEDLIGTSHGLLRNQCRSTL